MWLGLAVGKPTQRCGGGSQAGYGAGKRGVEGEAGQGGETGRGDDERRGRRKKRANGKLGGLEVEGTQNIQGRI